MKIIEYDTVYRDRNHKYKMEDGIDYHIRVQVESIGMCTVILSTDRYGKILQAIYPYMLAEKGFNDQVAQRLLLETLDGATEFFCDVEVSKPTKQECEGYDKIIELVLKHVNFSYGMNRKNQSLFYSNIRDKEELYRKINNVLK
jgi:hypothetical protein